MTEEKKHLPHTLHMENNKTLCVSGVMQIGNFDEQSVVLYLSDGKLTVRGNNLKIDRLSLETAEAELNGVIQSLQYSDARPRAKGLFEKVLR
ncbi:MAG: sporulation protein YabP [Clostridia bacterium]|nr:sporulation protein YabP [Clostridia bacterium]